MTEFEKAGGTYRKEGMYLLPNLTLPEEGQAADIGVWGYKTQEIFKTTSSSAVLQSSDGG